MVADVYLVTAEFPADERFGFISQMRRCAVSIPSNIAEGAGRKTRKDFAHFISIALGSAYELGTQCLLKLRGWIYEKQQLRIDNKSNNGSSENALFI